MDNWTFAGKIWRSVLLRSMIQMFVRVRKGKFTGINENLYTYKWYKETRQTERRYWCSSIYCQLWSERCLYRIYTMVRHCKLKLINRVKILKRCKITRDTLNNSLMVAKHTHRRLRFILRPLKIVYQVEYIQRCMTFTSTNVGALHCNDMDRIRSRLNTVHGHYFEET